jgi:hypothetical protein
MIIDGKTIAAAGGGMLIGVLITGMFLPMILKGTLTDVASVAAREVAHEVAVEIRPLVAQAIEDAKPNLTDSKERMDTLMGTGTDLLRQKLKERREKSD